MGQGLYSRLAAAGLAAALASGTFTRSTIAEAQTAAVSDGSCPYWIDAKTGERVTTTTIPAPLGVGAYREYLDSSRPDEAYQSGRNFVRQPDGRWIDAKTGERVTTTTIPAPLGVDAYREYLNSSRRDEAYQSGRNFVLIPCPPPSRAASHGLYIGGELAKNWGQVRSTEISAATGAVTNQFEDRGDPIGVGVVGGYNFRPWNNSVVIGPFVSFNYLNQTINHNFAGGQFLGTTTHWFLNAGVKAGVDVAPGLLLYGLAGVAWLNHDLNVNFATAAESNVTTPGFTAGLGGEYAPASWQLAGHPVSVFVQYQHTWWDNASFNTPASSPAFNYAFRREDDTFKIGVNFYFNAPPPAVASPTLGKPSTAN